jgi:hypothetical protein
MKGNTDLQLRLQTLAGDSTEDESVRVRLRSEDSSVLACVLKAFVPAEVCEPN